MNRDELIAHIQAAIDRMTPDDSLVEILGHLHSAARHKQLAHEQRGRGQHRLASHLDARAETYLSNARLLAQPGQEVCQLCESEELAHPLIRPSGARVGMGLDSTEAGSTWHGR